MAPRPQRGSLPSLLSLVAFAVVVVLLFGGGDGHKYTLIFQTAGQLVPDNQVLVGGQPVGTVESIDLTDDNQAAIAVTMRAAAARGNDGADPRDLALRRRQPLRLDQPGPEQHPGARTTRLGDSPRRHDPRSTSTSSSTSSGPRSARRSRSSSRATPTSTPATASRPTAPTSTSARPSAPRPSLHRAHPATRRRSARFLVAGSQTFAPRSPTAARSSPRDRQRQPDARRDREPKRGPRPLARRLPRTLRQRNTTFVNLRAALDDLDPLGQTAKPATKDLAPFLRNCGRSPTRALPVFTNLATPSTGRARTTTSPTRSTSCPTSKQRARKALPRNPKGDRRFQPTSTSLRPYTPDSSTAWLSKFGQVTAYYDGNGHYARVQPAGANLFNYNTVTNVATADSAARRTVPGPAQPAAARSALRDHAEQREPALSGRRLGARAGQLEPVRRQRPPTPADCNFVLDPPGPGP